MGIRDYELLKCEDCGKTLGYIYLSAKTYPPERWIGMQTGFLQKITKIAFCEDCFEKEKAKVKQKKRQQQASKTA